MKFSVLGSGSRGNSVYIQSGKTAVLLDAGFSGKEIQKRLLHAVGEELGGIKGILLTHEHNDHICGAGILSRRLSIPVVANEGTFRGGEKKLGKLPFKKEFSTGEKIVLQDLEIRSFQTLHDCNDPVGYVVSDGTFSLGYCTDTGKVTHLMAARMMQCDAIILEFNHDPEMLKSGPYPLVLQQRVRSSYGHLANDDAAAFLARLQSEHLRYVVLAHLSETNNLPEIAYAAAAKVNNESDCTLLLAAQNSSTGVINLNPSS
jgi:phosphoribosyl 1,2-cyclic phosphodiesterase